MYCKAINDRRHAIYAIVSTFYSELENGWEHFYLGFFEAKTIENVEVFYDAAAAKISNANYMVDFEPNLRDFNSEYWCFVECISTSNLRKEMAH